MVEHPLVPGAAGHLGVRSAPLHEYNEQRPAPNRVEAHVIPVPDAEFEIVITFDQSFTHILQGNEDREDIKILLELFVNGSPLRFGSSTIPFMSLQEVFNDGRSFIERFGTIRRVKKCRWEFQRFVAKAIEPGLCIVTVSVRVIWC